MMIISLKLKQAALTDAVVDIQDLFFRFMLDGFGLLAFGSEIKSLESGKVPFAVAFDRAQQIVNWRFFDGTFRITERLNWGKFKQYNQDLKTIRDFGHAIIQERRKESQESIENRSDLLSMMMAMKDGDGQAYSDEELCDHVLNFIIAGRDTTAQALSWAVYYLHLNPRVLKKLREEVDKVLGDEATPNYESNLKLLKYTKAVFHETLRLSPSVPKNGKLAVNDVELPDGTFVPAGAAVIINAYTNGRREDLWGSNAHEFVPERWLDASKPQPSQAVYPAFHGGPRLCLGKNLAEIEGVFVLASLVKSFEFQVLEPEKVIYALSLTFPIKNGLNCRFKVR